LFLKFYRNKNFYFAITLFIITLILGHSLIIGSNILSIQFITDVKESIYKNDIESPIEYHDGIPMVNYGYKRNVFVGLQYNPLKIARVGISYIENYNNTKDNNFLAQASVIAQWLLLNRIKSFAHEWNNSTNILEYSMWVYNFSYPYSKEMIIKPWYSAMAQGFLIDFFVRMYQSTNNVSYYQCAIEAFNALKISTKEGGLLIVEDNNLFWLPEVVEPNNLDKKRYILNGCLFVLQRLTCILEYNNITFYETDILNLENKTIANLLKNIEYYNYKDIWSNYDRWGTIAGQQYHRIHIDLLNYFYLRSNSSVLFEYINKWNNSEYTDFPKDFNWYYKAFLWETSIWLPYSLAITVLIDIIILIPILIIRYFKKRKQLTDLNKNDL